MLSIEPNSRKHDIAVYSSGRIDISAGVARALSLKPGDVIDIASEEKELFLYIKLRAGAYVGRHHGKVYRTSRGHNSTMRAWSRPLARAVLKLTGTPCVLKCPCGESFIRENKTYITIIYALKHDS